MSVQALNRKLNEHIIKTPNLKITREDVIKYYSSPEIVDKIFSIIKNKPIMIARNFNGEIVLQKHHDNRPIVIKKTDHDLDDTSNYYYYVPRRTVEFHYIYPQKSNFVTIDIDPNLKHFSDTKKITKAIYDFVRDHIKSDYSKLIYSGGRGFHIMLGFKSPIDVTEARKHIQEKFKPIVEEMKNKWESNKLTIGGKTGSITIDLSTMHEGGSIRVPYSLNASTGLVAIPVNEDRLHLFNPTVEAHPRRFI